MHSSGFGGGVGVGGGWGSGRVGAVIANLL